MGEYADIEIERQIRETGDRMVREAEAEDRQREIQRARTSLQAIGMKLIQKTVWHYQVLHRGRVVAQWWPVRGKTMIGQAKGPRCLDSKALVDLMRQRATGEATR